ncbi:complement factor H-like isoform X1 [Perca fluviatilis]|uniref:complement factor H-like isoform X1 n=1 Tax=Perca fluviatilis TaxID=8168 RepID=UPI0019631FA9|nr:complement factor H-like isoform X1 [Perca fluviatilis]
MCMSYIGFAFLVCFPGLLHARSAGQPCSAPTLGGGYWVLEENNLTYGCDNKLKPAVEGWWATSTCQNGTWSPEPQCINEKACIPPDIPNAQYKKKLKRWYENNQRLRVRCDEGYKLKGNDATAICTNGTWSSVPVCEKSIEACGEPPKIPHAVIIHQKYQELFDADSEVQYECEDGFTVEGGETKKIITCTSGNWTEGPTCRRKEVGPTASTGSGTQRAVGVKNCGQQPVVPHGDVVGNNQMFLRYQCAALYQRVGPERVICYSNGMWSEVPICKATFCSVDTDTHPELISDGVKIIKDGETEKLKCVHQDHWRTTHYSVVRCTNGIMSRSRCCDRWDAFWNC